VTIDYPTDPDVTTSYDALGRKTSVTDATATGTWTYTYAGIGCGDVVAQPTGRKRVIYKHEVIDRLIAN
jgi:uncharacterized protein RhaS with RHS repeats